MKILWLGDFFYDYNHIASDIEEISTWIKKNNFKTILNLEGCIYNKKKNPIEKRGPNLSSSTLTIDVLKKLNVIGVCLANNHIMDFGDLGLKETIEILDKNNIMHTGAGKNLEAALKPMIINIEGIECAVINFGWNIEETVYADNKTYGCAPRDEKLILKEVEKLKKRYSKVIISIHWGFEYNRLPMPYDIDLAHKLIDNGVELIIGHHPHCVQPKEEYNNGHIYYSLGNFYFSSRRKRFSKIFNESIPNQCDYGLAVTYNLEKKECQEFLIYYNRKKDNTEIKEITNNLILENLNDYEYLSPKYLKLSKQRKENINPILIINENKNYRMIKQLFLKYRIKKCIKKILKKR